MIAAQHDDPAVLAGKAVAVVDQTWRRLTGRWPEPSVSLGEAGGDSLGVLELIFNLERALGAKLPMLRFHSGLTAKEFTQAALAAIFIADNVKPQLSSPIFFCPPGFGDAGFLADFQRGYGEYFSFVGIEYPDWRRCVGSGLGSAFLIEAVTAQIRAAVPSGPIRLAGYSLGGRIAYAAAMALEEEGREVSFLGILDAPAPGATARRIEDAPSRLRNWWWGINRLAVAPREERNRRLGRALAHPLALGWAAPLRRLLARGSARNVDCPSLGSLSDWATYYLGHRLLSAACTHISGTTPRTGHKLSAPIVLFRCAGWLANAGPDLGWGSVAKDVTIVPLAGDHWSSVSQPYVSSTATSFVDALAMIEGNRLRQRGQVTYCVNRNLVRSGEAL